MMTMKKPGSCSKMETVLFGIDSFLSKAAAYNNARFGLVTNHAALTSTGISGRVALLQAGFTVTQLFSPEHGLSVRGVDGAYQPDSIDQLTQLPITSLYGDHLIPTAADLAELDMVVFDIPDVGCRFYTYLWTLTYVMEACAQQNKPLIILDRPNPIGGDIQHSEGPMLDEKNCSSFIGRWNIPVRHSCTLGELARYFSATRIKDLNLKVIPVQNWNRKQTVTESGWHFVPTSPAIRDPETALLYPGLGLLEGLNVNEGRGTASPFKLFGAPWINAEQIHSAFTDLPLPGIHSEPITYTPESGYYSGEICQGLQFSVSDNQVFQPVKTGLHIIQLIKKLYPEKTGERLYHTVANPTGTGHLDKLTGVYRSFEKIKNPELLITMNGKTDPVWMVWKKMIGPYLLY